MSNNLSMVAGIPGYSSEASYYDRLVVTDLINGRFWFVRRWQKDATARVLNNLQAVEHKLAAGTRKLDYVERQLQKMNETAAECDALKRRVVELHAEADGLEQENHRLAAENEAVHMDLLDSISRHLETRAKLDAVREVVK